MDKLQENIAEIGMYIGNMMGKGDLDKEGLDISSTEMSASIVTWADEFEQKYGNVNFLQDTIVEGLGEVFGYLAAIDRFTEIKANEAGWINNSNLT